MLNPARVMEQHRGSVEVRGAHGLHTLPLLQSMPGLTVGDWVLLTDDAQFVRALERKSVFKRKAAGSKLAEQLIAANVDTAFIVRSLNEDFNLNRIERFLSVAHQAGTEAVLVLSKLDLCSNAEELRGQAQSLDSHLCVEAVNCLSEPSVARLAPWRLDSGYAGNARDAAGGLRRGCGGDLCRYRRVSKAMPFAQLSQAFARAGDERGEPRAVFRKQGRYYKRVISETKQIKRGE